MTRTFSRGKPWEADHRTSFAGRQERARRLLNLPVPGCNVRLSGRPFGRMTGLRWDIGKTVFDLEAFSDAAHRLSTSISGFDFSYFEKRIEDMTRQALGLSPTLLASMRGATTSTMPRTQHTLSVEMLDKIMKRGIDAKSFYLDEAHYMGAGKLDVFSRMFGGRTLERDALARHSSSRVEAGRENDRLCRQFFHQNASERFGTGIRLPEGSSWMSARHEVSAFLWGPKREFTNCMILPWMWEEFLHLTAGGRIGIVNLAEMFGGSRARVQVQHADEHVWRSGRGRPDDHRAPHALVTFLSYADLQSWREVLAATA